MTPTRRKPRAQCWRSICHCAGDTLKLVNKISQICTRDIVAHSGAAAGALGKSDDLLKFPRSSTPRPGLRRAMLVQEDGSGMSPARLGDTAGPGGVAAVCAKAILVSSLLRFVAGGGNRWTLTDRMKKAGMMGRIHAKTGSVSCANTFRLCRYAGGKASDFLVLEQQRERAGS